MQVISKLITNFPQVALVHILTFFMTGQCIKRFENHKEFPKLKFYSIFLNNELCQYHCLLSDCKQLDRPALSHNKPSWQKRSSNLALSSITNIDQQLGGLELTKSKSYMTNGTATNSLRKYSAGLMMAAGGGGFGGGGDGGSGADEVNGEVDKEEEVDKSGEIGADLMDGL